MKRIGWALLVLIAGTAAVATVLAPNPPDTQFPRYALAPPMRPRLVDAAGGVRAPFIYSLEPVDRVAGTFHEDRSRRVPLQWFSGRRLAQTSDPDVPLLLLGGDSLGRDVFARLLHGARLSLGVAAVAVAGALTLGALVGLCASLVTGWVGEGLMRVADFVFVLPALYVVLALRAALPLVLSPLAVFVALASVLALAGWPPVARGVRAIAARELTQEYALAARAAGASRWRLATRHLLPAMRSMLGTHALWLLPGCVLAEATLSYVGLGFAEPIPSWGTLLQEAANLQLLRRAPWLLTPAAGMVLTVFAINLVLNE